MRGMLDKHLLPMFELIALCPLYFFCMKVLVHLFEDSNVCSAAYNLGNYQQEVGVQALSSHSVPFVIIFNQPGDYTIEVKATVKHSTVSDGIRKGLQVLVGKHNSFKIPLEQFEMTDSSG